MNGPFREWIKSSMDIRALMKAVAMASATIDPEHSAN